MVTTIDFDGTLTRCSTYSSLNGQDLLDLMVAASVNAVSLFQLAVGWQDFVVPLVPTPCYASNNSARAQNLMGKCVHVGSATW
mmetsp:Transcript_40996/g.64001  ORF Transcript_40996/g.64001 Transcript_40996/m.64001 type:complete len:83 (-) Transcript_40996:280-528(-)